MTNAEKYLKEGVEAKEIWHNYQEFLMNNDKTENACTFVEFMEEKATPTLTEDERVILRNLKQFNIVGRGADFIYVSLAESPTYKSERTYLPFADLFKFIKERRRI